MHLDNDHGDLGNLKLLFLFYYGSHEFTDICNHGFSHWLISVSNMGEEEATPFPKA